jgi:NADH-ubiquinone oxidoreductase chain 5
MYLLVVFLPLLGSIIAGLFGRFIGKQGSIIITTLSVFLSALISFFIFYEVLLCHSICTIKLFP